MRLRFLPSIVFLIVLSSIMVLSVSASGNREVAVSTISDAEESMALAYEAVLNAERAGANVFGLLVRLNDGAGLLSEARMAFEAGGFEEAVRLAELSGAVGVEIRNEAEGLEFEANDARADMSWWFLEVSVLSMPIVVCASFLGYRYFKKRYYRRLLKMKPKVGRT